MGRGRGGVFFFCDRRVSTLRGSSPRGDRQCIVVHFLRKPGENRRRITKHTDQRKTPSPLFLLCSLVPHTSMWVESVSRCVRAVVLLTHDTIIIMSVVVGCGSVTPKKRRRNTKKSAEALFLPTRTTHSSPPPFPFRPPPPLGILVPPYGEGQKYGEIWGEYGVFFKSCSPIFPPYGGYMGENPGVPQVEAVSSSLRSAFHRV